MNVLPDLKPSNNPTEGDLYYDLKVGTTKMFIGGLWHPIADSPKQFYWLEDTKLPVLKILNGLWFMEHYDEILEWLHDTQGAEYSSDTALIIFKSEKYATLFQLKWG